MSEQRQSLGGAIWVVEVFNQYSGELMPQFSIPEIFYGEETWL